jgi:hypothetical protein
MGIRRIGLVLLAGAAGAAPVQARESGPRMEVRAASILETKTVRVRVLVRAPLPDGTGLVFLLRQAACRDAWAAPLAATTGRMRAGACRQDLTIAPDRTPPGEYVVSARVDADQPQALRRSLRPSLRRLAGEARVVVGGRARNAAAVTEAARMMLGASRRLQEEYPALAAMLARAWRKDLPAADWKSWPKRAALLQGCRTLDGARAHPVMRLFPRTTGKAQALTVEVLGMIGTIDNFVSGEEPTDEPVKPRKPTDPLIRTSVDGLHVELYREGYAAYVANATQLFAEIEAAFAARRAREWKTLETGWSRTIREMAGHWEAFKKLPWPLEGGEASLRLTEALVGIREFAACCGRVLRGELTETESGLAASREALRQRLAALARPPRLARR